MNNEFYFKFLEHLENVFPKKNLRVVFSKLKDFNFARNATFECADYSIEFDFYDYLSFDLDNPISFRIFIYVRSNEARYTDRIYKIIKEFFKSHEIENYTIVNGY